MADKIHPWLFFPPCLDELVFLFIRRFPSYVRPARNRVSMWLCLCLCFYCWFTGSYMVLLDFVIRSYWLFTGLLQRKICIDLYFVFLVACTFEFFSMIYMFFFPFLSFIRFCSASTVIYMSFVLLKISGCLDVFFSNQVSLLLNGFQFL